MLVSQFLYSQDYETYTYKLSQSNANYTFWTTLPSIRVFKNSEIPTETGNLVKIYAAKNEFEPFVVVVKPKTSGKIKIDFGSFGNEMTTEMYVVKYINITKVSDNLGKTGAYPDALFPVENHSTIDVTANENISLWFSVSVSQNATKGDYSTNVSVAGVNIPVKLHVFNFSIPAELHTHSLMYFSFQNVLTKYGVQGTGTEYWNYVDKIKQFFIDHRLTPSNPLWSGGLTSNGGNPYIDYDCNGKFTDKDGIWGFEQPAEKYLKGKDFNNGTGFPSFMAATYRNNDASADQRPDNFCGVTKSSSDWYTAANPNTNYNTKWFNYVKAMQNYLSEKSLLNKSYYYFANEPQDQADYDAVAWYSQELKKVAPNLKLMVSEEPKPEIFNHSKYKNAKIDIWLPVLQNYNPTISFDRELNHKEETWIYFLHSTRPPYFNPITLDHPGIESKFTGWFLWKYRIKGIAYYSTNNWSQNPYTSPMNSNHNGELFLLYPPSLNNSNIAYGSNHHRFVPSMRFELIRDGLEDYEYFYLLNGNKNPVPKTANSSDKQVDKIILGLTSYTRDDEFLYNLRRLVGLKLGNEIATIPDIKPNNLHPRSQGNPGNYYINFQDPQGEPKANPLVVGGKTYTKIGWNSYDAKLGFGWFGDLSHIKYQFLSSGNNILQQSIIYDDWGRQKTFEFDLPNGNYNVTVSVGWKDKTYSHQKISIEGINFINDEATTPAAPYLVRKKQISITDYKLTMEMGIFDEYTMLNYLIIEAVGGNFINESEKELINISPNPAKENLTVYLGEKIPCSLQIFDNKGVLISHFENIKTSEFNLNVSNFAKGIYFLKIVENSSQKQHFAKFIVE